MLNVSFHVKVSRMLITKYKMCLPETVELLQFLFSERHTFQLTLNESYYFSSFMTCLWHYRRQIQMLRASYGCFRSLTSSTKSIILCVLYYMMQFLSQSCEPSPRHFAFIPHANLSIYIGNSYLLQIFWEFITVMYPRK